jgi:hypothetical protein
MVDELELISRLREEVPLGSADRAEHAFLASIRCPGARPVRREGLVRRLRPRAGIAVSLATAAAGSPPAGTPAMRRRTTAIIISAATAAGLAAAGLTLLPGNSSLPGSTSGASPAAAQLLAKIAAAAAAQPNPPVSDSQFVYLKTWGAGSVCAGRASANSPSPSPSPSYSSSSSSSSRSRSRPRSRFANRYVHSVHVAGPGRCVPGKPDEVQFWYPVSSLCATGEFLMDGRMTKFSFKAAAANPKQFPCNGNMNYPTYRFMQTLPTDPHALLRLIQQTDHYPTAGGQGLYWAFFTIGELLYNGPPPPVTAALYRAAALIPGVTVVPDATDTIGRPGIAVAYTFQRMRTEWFFSKQTLQYLGSREIDITNGVLLSQQAIQQHAIVDHAGQIPR